MGLSVGKLLRREIAPHLAARAAASESHRALCQPQRQFRTIEIVDTVSEQTNQTTTNTIANDRERQWVTCIVVVAVAIADVIGIDVGVASHAAARP